MNKLRLALLSTALSLLVCFGMAAAAQAQGILVYRGEQWGSGSEREYSDFAAAAGRPLTYLDVTMPDNYDLSAYECVILSGFFSSDSAAFLPQTKAKLAAYVNNGGHLLAIAEHYGFPGTIAAMNDLSNFLGGQLLVTPADLDDGPHVTSRIDPSPFTTGVAQIGLAASSEVRVLVSGSAHSVVRSVAGTTVLGADRVGLGWFILSGDSNIFSDNLRVYAGVDVYALYDNGVLASNIVGGDPRLISDENLLASMGGAGSTGGGFAFGSSQNSTSSMVGEPVNAATGNFYLEAQDHNVSGCGPLLAFSRSYNARFPVEGSLGFGWRHSYEMSVEEEPDESRAVVTYADGHTALFDLPPLSVGVSLDLGWNLVAGGPGSDTGELLLFGYDGSSYESGSAEVIEVGGGYWVRAPSGGGAAMAVVAAPIAVSLTPGWNLIGNSSCDDVSVPEGYVAFAFDGHEYCSTTTLAPGEGAWIKGDASATVSLEPAGIASLQYEPYPGNFARLSRDSSGYTLDEKSQTVFRFDPEGTLQSITDEAGNSLTLSYDSSTRLKTVTDDAGRTLTFDYGSSGYLASVVDPLGRVTTYSHDSAGNLIAVTDRAGATTHYAYDENHRMTSATDALLRTFVTSEFDEVGRAVRQWDALGSLSTFAYLGHSSAPGLYDTIFTDARGHATTYSYDADLREVAQTDALGNMATFAYDADSNRVSSTDKRGSTTTFTYDERGNLTSRTDALGNTTTNTYDEESHLLTTTDARGAVTSVSYDAFGNPISATDALGSVSASTYDARGLRLTLTDALERTTSYNYDTYGNLTRTTYPDGTHTDSTHDLAGRVLATIDELGNTTTFAYDREDRVTSHTDALGNAVTRLYSAAGELISETDRTGRTTTFAHDVMGRLSTQTDPAGGVTVFTYDKNGNRASITDASGRTSLSRYDALDRLIEEEDPLGNISTIAYDANGNRASAVDPRGKRTSFTCDVLNRLTRVTDALGGTQSYTYDEVGNRTSVTDPLGQTISTTYDELDRPVTVTDRAGETSTSFYDAAGRVTKTVDRLGRETTYTYDLRDHLLTLTDSDGPTNYTHDLAGRRLTATDAAGTITTTFDELGRATARTDPHGATVGYAYDEEGRRASLTYPDGKASTSAYDGAGRLALVTDWTGAQTAYVYDPAGRLLTTTYPNVVLETRAYDGAGRLTRITTAKDASVLENITYAYDSRGNRKSETALSGTTTYSYDALSRLASVTYPDASAESYTYDAAGNRLTKTRGAGTTSYAYDAAGRLQSVIDPGGETTFAYDANGNTLSRVAPSATTTYTYDAKDRTVGISDGTQVQTMTYDADAVRIAQTLDGATTAYVQDALAGNEQIAQEITAAATTSHVLGLSHIATTDGSSTTYLHADALGSARLLTDGSGAVQGTTAYDAWGQVVGASGPQSSLGFTGEEQGGFGLTYLRARFYDSALGRFLQEDSLPGLAIDTQGLAAYVYCRDNPVVLTDPSGRMARQLQDWLTAHGRQVGEYIKTNWLKLSTEVMFEGYKGFVGGTLQGLRDVAFLSNPKDWELAVRAIRAQDILGLTKVVSASGSAITGGLSSFWDAAHSSSWSEGGLNISKGLIEGGMSGLGSLAIPVVGGPIGGWVGTQIFKGVCSVGLSLGAGMDSSDYWKSQVTDEVLSDQMHSALGMPRQFSTVTIVQYDALGRAVPVTY